MTATVRNQIALVVVPIAVALAAALAALASVSSLPVSIPPVVAASAPMVPGGEPAPTSVGVYAATVVRIVDGDTLDADVSLPLKTTVRARLRLLGINCPETHGTTREAGDAAKAFTEGLVDGKPIVVRSDATDAFGRWLADAWVDGRHVNAAILDAGHAVPFPR